MNIPKIINFIPIQLKANRTLKNIDFNNLQAIQENKEDNKKTKVESFSNPKKFWLTALKWIALIITPVLGFIGYINFSYLKNIKPKIALFEEPIKELIVNYHKTKLPKEVLEKANARGYTDSIINDIFDETMNHFWHKLEISIGDRNFWKKDINTFKAHPFVQDILLRIKNKTLIEENAFNKKFEMVLNEAIGVHK